MSYYNASGSGHEQRDDAPGRSSSAPLRSTSASSSLGREEALVTQSTVEPGRGGSPNSKLGATSHNGGLIEGFSPLPGFHPQSLSAYKPSAPYSPPGHAAYRGSIPKPVDENLIGRSQQQPYIPPPPRASHSASPFRGGAAFSPSSRFNSLTTGIMSENVQQRYLFSKRPNYGPLATPIATLPPDPIRPHTANAAGAGGVGESWRNHAGARGRFMPKLGQGDARNGGVCEFSLFRDPVKDGVTQSEASESREIAENSNWKDTATGSLSLPAPPLSFSPNSAQSFKSPNTPHEDSGGYFPSESNSTESLFRAEKLHRRPHGPPECDMNTTAPVKTTPGENSSFTSILGTAPSVPTLAPRTSTKPTRGGRSVLNPTAAEFVHANTQPYLHPSHRLPNYLPTVRPRPVHWGIQCRWTAPPHGTSVMDCRYGDHCNYGHEGDEYFDAPGVRYGFADWGVYQTLLNNTAPVEKEAEVYEFEMVGKDGYLPSHQPSDGNDNGAIRAPDFSWSEVGCFGNRSAGGDFRKEHPTAGSTREAGSGNGGAEGGGGMRNGDSESTFFTATED